MPDTLPLRSVPPDSAETPRPDAGPVPLLLDGRDAARLCGVSPATWYRMVAAGRCPAPVRLSAGCVRWRAQELRAWVEAGCPDRRTWEALRAARRDGRPR
jgi:predicted DNA-binding transcriptional regulator AlpA